MCELTSNGVSIFVFKASKPWKRLFVLNILSSKEASDFWIFESFDTALAIENRRGVGIVLLKVYEPMKLCYVVSIVHFAAQRKKS